MPKTVDDARSWNNARMEKMEKYNCWNCCLLEHCDPRKPCRKEKQK